MGIYQKAVKSDTPFSLKAMCIIDCHFAISSLMTSIMQENHGSVYVWQRYQMKETT